MPVSPQDFELYSRMTGTPMPTDAMSRMQMAPEVFKFTKDFAKKPNILEKTGNLVKNIGRGAVMALGAPLVAASEAENARMQEQLRNQSRVTGDSEVERVKTPAEIIEDKRMARLERTAQIKKEERDDKERIAMNMLKAKAGEIETYSIPANSTTADSYGQDFVPNQTSSKIIDRKMEQGSQIADSTPNIAEVLSESQDSIPVDESFPVGDARRNMRSVEEIERNLQEDMETASLTRIGGPEGGVGKSQLAKFLTQKGLDQALLGAIGERMTPEPRIGDSSPLIDHPDLPGGEDDINLPSGTNTSPTTNLQEQTGGGESLNKRYVNQHYEDMRKMEAQERLKRKSPSEKQINLLEQRAIANEEAINSGFMNLDDEGRKKESIRLGSTGGIPNKTDMAEIRKDPEFIAAQESMKPKSTTEKVDEFTNKIMPNKPSSFVESMSLDLSADKAPTATFNLNQKEGGTKPYSVQISSPMAVSLNEMAEDGSLKEESFGKLFNLAKKSIKDGSGMAFGIDQ